MRSKLTDYGWKLGLLVALGLPMLYIMQAVILGTGMRQDSLIVDVVLSAAQIAPFIAIAAGLGTIICLLVRIESHLHKLAERTD